MTNKKDQKRMTYDALAREHDFAGTPYDMSKKSKKLLEKKKELLKNFSHLHGVAKGSIDAGGVGL